MAKRTLVALTPAQMGIMQWAFKNLQEDGTGMVEGPDTRHIENIERQMRGEYTASERVAIFEAAKALSKDQRNG